MMPQARLLPHMTDISARNTCVCQKKVRILHIISYRGSSHSGHGAIPPCVRSARVAA